MIEEITIRNLGVISDARLVFSRGLTALTGETGAGKTMVLSALGLLLGERSDSSAVRHGAEQTFVEGRWYLADKSESNSGTVTEVKALLDDAGIDFEDRELILNRSVNAEGRSRASANGRAIPIGTVGEIGSKLVVVHGQADQIRLKSAKAQREALDAYAGAELLENLSRLKLAFAAFNARKNHLDELRLGSQQRVQRVAELRQNLSELEALNPQAGEFEAICSKIERLSNSESLRAAVAAAHEVISSSGFGDSADALSLIGAARKSLDPVSSSDDRLRALEQRLSDLGYQLGDIAAELSGYLVELEGESEDSLEWLQERKSGFVRLSRRFDVDAAELDLLISKFSDELLALDDSDEAIQALEAEVASLKSECEGIATAISSARRLAAESLAAEVSAEFAGLAMPNARLIVELTRTEVLTAHGWDEVSFQLAAYNGAQARPISKGASGGELSRIMLALEVVLAKGEQAPTFIFDEVDAGVGGEAAIEVGRRLARLAHTAQVIVVTHLAQVAAFADRHLRVLKSYSDDVTSSDVVALEGEPRIAELARMISGLADSEAARKNAQELLALARQSV